MDLRISETARQIGVTTATIRNWIKHFGDFLSSAAIQPTRKRFTPRDVATLKEINRLSREGNTWDEIIELLPSQGEVIEDYQEPIPEQHQDQTNAIQQTEMYEQFMRLFNQQSDNHQRELERLETSKNETIQVLKDEIEYLKRPWYKRLTR